MDKYEELMARRELIFARWMEYVERIKLASDKPLELASAGVMLTPTGTLRMQGRNALQQLQLELEIAAGETEVRVTFESARFKLRLS